MSGATDRQRKILLMASAGILAGLLFGLFMFPFSGAYPEPNTAYSYDHDAGDDPGGGDHGGDDGGDDGGGPGGDDGRGPGGDGGGVLGVDHHPVLPSEVAEQPARVVADVVLRG